MYAANQYIRVNGKRYVAGEILPEDLPQEKIDWLLSKGAIEFIPNAIPISAETPSAPAEIAEDEEETPECAIDEEEEPEEIDAAEGIIPASKPAAKPAAKTAAKRKGGRK